MSERLFRVVDVRCWHVDYSVMGFILRVLKDYVSVDLFEVVLYCIV